MLCLSLSQFNSVEICDLCLLDLGEGFKGEGAGPNLTRRCQSLILLHVTLLGVTVDDVGTVDVSVGVAV